MSKKKPRSPADVLAASLADRPAFFGGGPLVKRPAAAEPPSDPAPGSGGAPTEAA